MKKPPSPNKGSIAEITNDNFHDVMYPIMKDAINCEKALKATPTLVPIPFSIILV